jgi:hypothetical protein
MPGPSKAAIADKVGCVGGGGMGIPGPLAKATLLESTRTAARMAKWNLKLFDVMDNCLLQVQLCTKRVTQKCHQGYNKRY